MQSHYQTATLNTFNNSVSDSLKTYTGIDQKYELSGVVMHYDASDIKSAVTPFKIERLQQGPFADNKYYSIAPLPTDEHWALLEQFEAILNG